MGSSTDVMHRFIEREIASNFPQNDGWSVEQASAIAGYNKILSLGRFYNGVKETVRVGVCLDRAVAADFINLVQGAAAGAAGSSTVRLAVLVAKNADTSAVPASWKVLTLDAFGFEGENLVWYKNPARRPKPEAAKAPAA